MHHRIVRLVLFSLAVGLLVASCGASATVAGGGPSTTGESAPDSDTAPIAGGVLQVRLEEVQGIFTEGFEVGLRFEDSDGNTLGTVQWTDWVAGSNPESPEAYYTSVYEQPVPAGTVVVMASSNIGIGPAPEKPDVNGDLRCGLEVEVPAGGTSLVEVSFDGTADCLSQVS